MKTRKKKQQRCMKTTLLQFMLGSPCPLTSRPFFFAHKLCLSFLSETFLLVSKLKKADARGQVQKS